MTTELPAELDFFKYAQNTQANGKRKQTGPESLPKVKKRKTEHTDDEEDEELEQAAVTTEKKHVVGHRLSAKGSNVPPPIESFDALKDQEKYNIPNHIFPNLVSSGYMEPTSIQAACIPILLEVWMQNLCVTSSSPPSESRPGSDITHWNR